MEFNELHPTHYGREQGWKPEPNPFAPRAPQSAHQYCDKHIFIYAAQLWYDVDATTNLVGRHRRDNQTSQGERVPTSENDEERPLFYRWFDKYLQKAETTLSAYVMKKEGKVRDNAIKQWDEKEIWLRMPDYWDDSRLDSLTKAIHDYITTGALLEYFKYTLTSKDPLTVDKQQDLEDAELEMVDCVNATKPGSMVKPWKPFG